MMNDEKRAVLNSSFRIQHSAFAFILCILYIHVNYFRHWRTACGLTLPLLNALDPALVPET